MVDWLSILETDKVIHTVETDIVKIVDEIESFGMSFDEFDKETGSSDGYNQSKRIGITDIYATTKNYNAGDEILRQHMIASDAKFQLLANQMTKIKKAFNERPQGALPSNTIPNPREDIKLITTQSGITLAGPSVSPPNSSSSSSKEVEGDPETTMDQVHISSSECTARVPSPVIQPAFVSKSNEIPERNLHQPPIHCPSRLNKDKL
ncbi:hypothetical protein Tco_0390696 [Tanacetum coccineum]